MPDLPLETKWYALETSEGTVLEVPARDLDDARALLDGARTDLRVARELLLLRDRFQAPSIQKRALELFEIYEKARRRNAKDENALRRIERRWGVSVYRDYLVLAVCRKGTFALTHDPDLRGEALASVFRMDEDLSQQLDILDKALFRLRFANRQGMRFLTDEEWDDAAPEP